MASVPKRGAGSPSLPCAPTMPTKETDNRINIGNEGWCGGIIIDGEDIQEEREVRNVLL